MLARKLVLWPILLLITGVQGQPSERSVLLPSLEVKQAARFFDFPGTVTGVWTPEKPDLDSLETNLGQVTNLPNNWGGRVRIEHPEQYYRQYLGIMVSGKKRVFIDAFCDLQGMSYWREHLVIVADGATCFWHALFDPDAKKFSDLYINGRA